MTPEPVQPAVETRTKGLSPKLYPAIIAILTGIVLILTDNDDIGIAVLLTGVGGLGFGAALPPGEVSVTHTVTPTKTARKRV